MVEPLHGVLVLGKMRGDVCLCLPYDSRKRRKPVVHDGFVHRARAAGRALGVQLDVSDALRDAAFVLRLDPRLYVVAGVVEDARVSVGAHDGGLHDGIVLAHYLMTKLKMYI